MVKDRLSEIIEKVAKDLGYLIYDFTVYLKGEHSRISVKLDSLKGISHKDCENFSHRLSEELDRVKLLPNYFLEVSSPGIKRNVRSLDEFMRFNGAPVKVIYDSDSGRQVVKGVIAGVEGEKVKVTTEKEDVNIPFGVIVNANLDY